MRLRLLIECEVPERELPHLAELIGEQRNVAVEVDDSQYNGQLTGAQQVHLAN